jgi:hypothetical protein
MKLIRRILAAIHLKFQDRMGQLPFALIAPNTVPDFKALCHWNDLCARKLVLIDETIEQVSGLQPSVIFPGCWLEEISSNNFKLLTQSQAVEFVLRCVYARHTKTRGFSGLQLPNENNTVLKVSNYSPTAPTVAG